MIIKFQKYQGAGNDFVIIDNRKNSYVFSNEIVSRLCDRKFGIGADGLMLLEEAEGYDFRMRYFNSDGAEASMCGNGGRCIVAFAHKLGIFNGKTCFIAVDGEHEAEISGKVVKLKMCDVEDVAIEKDYFFMNTGSPHYVKVTDDAFVTDVFNEGRVIRYSDAFKPGGTNVNFITPTSDYIKVATYERGVEDETLACGTGCVASALSVAILRKDKEGCYPIRTKGGDLSVCFEQKEGHSFCNIWLEGPAEFVFSGEISL